MCGGREGDVSMWAGMEGNVSIVSYCVFVVSTGLCHL